MTGGGVCTCCRSYHSSFDLRNSKAHAYEMSSSDSVSAFAEGTFEEQLQELLEYTAQGIPDEDRTALLQSLQDVKTGNAPLDEDARRTAFELVLKNTKSVGQGTDHGMCTRDRSHSLLTLQQRSKVSSIFCIHICSLCGRLIRRKREST